MLKADSKNKLLISVLKQIDSSKKIDVAKLSSEFGITNKSIYKHIKSLIENKQIIRTGKGDYKIVKNTKRFSFQNTNLHEDEIWRLTVEPILPQMTKEAKQALAHIFTEIFNNAIEHSKSETIDIFIDCNILFVEIGIVDYGIGIFENIKQALNLSEKRHAILELAKGKFTSEPESHSGEGIFFSSKMADEFLILSDDLLFSDYNNEPILFDFTPKNWSKKGTIVNFKVYCESKINLLDLYKTYTQMPDAFGFTKTIVPVNLLEYGTDETSFISRSQAKRLLLRFDKFENVVLDFDGVESIGQAFADEIFRVFKNAHPNTEIRVQNCNKQIENMIAHVKRDS